MSFAGGVFTRLYSYTADAAAGITAQPTRFDADLNDMAGGLSLCILRDGTGVPIANIPFGGYRITGLADPVNPQDAATRNYALAAVGGAASGGLTLTGNFVVTAGAITSSGSITGGSLVTAGSIVGGTLSVSAASTFGAAVSITAGGAAITGAVTVTGTIAVTGIVTSNSIELGFRDVPQNPQSAAYTLALTDRGEGIYYTGAAAVITIPANVTIAFPIGAIVTLVNDGSGTLTLTRAAGVTMKWAGTGANSDRSLAIAGIATFIKVGTNTWFVSGVGLT